MLEKIRIVYVTEWLNEHNSSHSDPFGMVLSELNADISIQNTLPEQFDQVDLLILHPMQMNSSIFDTISQSKS